MSIESTDAPRLGEICDEVWEECLRATGKYPPMNSHHEAYAVILEELDEYWEEVRKKKSERDLDNTRLELVQIAAMAIRAYFDLCKK